MDTSYKVTLEEKRFPGKTVVIVEEDGVTINWPFHRKKDAEIKAAAEIRRLQEDRRSH